MKLSIDCVRDVLLTLEEELPLMASQNVGMCVKRITLESICPCKRLKGYPKDDVFYTITKLQEGGIIKTTIFTNLFGETIIKDIEEITHTGHELLDAIRPETVFEKVKKVFNEQGAAMTIGAIFTVAAEVMAKLIH